MILIRKAQKPTLHPHRLQHIKGRQSLSNRQSIIQLIVDNQMRRRPVIQMRCGVPFLVPSAVLPERAAEIVGWEEELVAGPLVQRAEDAVVRYEG